jgi:hypothetical protein
MIGAPSAAAPSGTIATSAAAAASADRIAISPVPQQWGRIARRGAGNMEYEDPETIAQREEYKQRKGRAGPSRG